MGRSTSVSKIDMWREIFGSYRISRYGKVESLITGKEIKQFEGKDGYMRIQIAGKTRLVHRIVAMAFIEKPSGKDFVNHIDGIKQNNNVRNLEWCTRSENMIHAYATGLKSSKGCHNSRAILDEQDVLDIRRIYVRGDKNYGTKALAERYGVARQTISAVVCKQNWK